MSNTIPIPPPMVYSNKLEFAIPIATVTASNWYEALMGLQSTREARAAMRDVWEWEQTSKQFRRQEEEATTKARASSPVVVPPPPPQCLICNSPLSSSRQKRFCSRACSKQADKAKEKEKRRANREPLSCGVCRAEFYPNWPGSKYCSPQCSNQSIRATDRRRKAELKALAGEVAL